MSQDPELNRSCQRGLPLLEISSRHSSLYTDRDARGVPRHASQSERDYDTTYVDTRVCACPYGLVCDGSNLPLVSCGEWSALSVTLCPAPRLCAVWAMLHPSRNRCRKPLKSNSKEKCHEKGNSKTP